MKELLELLHRVGQRSNEATVQEHQVQHTVMSHQNRTGFMQSKFHPVHKVLFCEGGLLRVHEAFEVFFFEVSEISSDQCFNDPPESYTLPDLILCAFKLRRLSLFVLVLVHGLDLDKTTSVGF